MLTRHKTALALWIVIVLSALGLLICVERPEFIPVTLISSVALWFSYLAYLFSEERFRLGLLDRRFEIYNNTLDFCSHVMQEGDLKLNDRNKDQIEKAFKSAHESFRGIGWHKSRALFGEDIQEVFEKLNKIYSWLLAYSHDPDVLDDPEKVMKHAEEWSNHMTTIWKIVNELPELFRPYIYFGDYKRDW